MAIDFLVRRDDLRAHRTEPAPEIGAVALADGDALLAVDAFALTANNVTYGAMGDALDYWRFFPAPPSYGRIPAWGFGTVARSKAAGVPEGARYYGYFPMSTYVVMHPSRIRPATFTDAVPHRAALHPLYNQYTLTPAADDEADALQLLLRPLFLTSFVIDDFLAESAFFGARRIVVSSASSKTAYGLAFLLAARRDAGAAIEPTGLTSAGNAGFVERLRLYDRVLPYDAVDSLEPNEPAIFIDFAANDVLRRAVHARLGDALRYSGSIGVTHWDQGAAAARAPLPGPAPVPFFAPAQIAKCVASWGSEGFGERFDAAWTRFTAAIRTHGASWLSVRHGSGPEDLASVYDAALSGTLRPNEGHVLRLP